MSKRGEWKTYDGRIMKLAEMGDSHLRNSLKYMLRNVGANLVKATGAEQIVVQEISRQNKYYEDKIIELGEEAQRRGWIAQDITIEQLYDTIRQWETIDNAAKARYRSNYTVRPVYAPATPPQHVDVIEQIASRPPRTICMYADIADTVEQIISPRIAKLKNVACSPGADRNLSFDL